jgi:hypothetical protein
MALHVFGLLQFHNLQDGRRDIGQNAIIAQFDLSELWRDQVERYGVGGMRGQRFAGIILDELFSVPMIRCDQDIATDCQR